MARRAEAARVGITACESGPSRRLARTVSLDRLGLDVTLAPGNQLQLSAGEHLGLVAVVGRRFLWALPVGENGVRTRLVAELDRENPPVRPDSDALSVRV